MVWYSHLFQNFLQFIVIHTVKGFGIVNKAEIDIFLELCCFFDDPMVLAVLALWFQLLDKIHSFVLAFIYLSFSAPLLPFVKSQLRYHLFSDMLRNFVLPASPESLFRMSLSLVYSVYALKWHFPLYFFTYFYNSDLWPFSSSWMKPYFVTLFNLGQPVCCFTFELLFA